MASLTETWIVCIFFPQPLPMHKDIDVVPIDHNALNRKVHRDSAKRFEIALRFFPQSVKMVDWHHERGQIGRIFPHIRLTKRFDRSIDTEIPFVIFGILKRLAPAADANQQ
jgi:hypothetical protein